MSVSKWAYVPEVCDGRFCCGDCDYCDMEDAMAKFEHIGHPPPGRQCEIHTVDGHYYEAVWVERINKYVDCQRWRRTDSGLSKKERWIDDKDVIEWREL